tara:strand:+ start:106392 stop:106766 length:375 start_codon:yes stop_codon:yes gene_type:complete
MRALKLIDIVLQGTSLLIGFMFLFVFGGSGYLYWINMGILGWIAISSILHVVVIKKQNVGRIIYVSIYGLALIGGGIAHFSGVSFPRINFYLQPASYLFIIMYLILSIIEYQEYRIPKEDTLDF